MDKENQNLISLVIDTQNDVEGAFEKLYHESFRHAYCTASLLLKNEQDVEDVLQNGYMYVAKYIKDLKNPESFNNWLGVIVKHECQKYISKQKRISDIFIAVKKTKESDLTDECNLPVDYIEKSETRDAIQRIVDDLPDDKRACVVLFYYEQHSLTEISEILGVPEGTVMSRLFYARKKLEKEFKKLQKKDESLFGISIIPLIVSLFAYQAKTVVIPTAVKNGIVAAVTAEGAAAVTTTATAAVGSSTAAVSTVSASTAVGAAGTAVATKVTAVAVATSVAIGGGVATVNHIKNNNEPVTTQTSVTSTVEYATFANVIVEETTEYWIDSSDGKINGAMYDVTGQDGSPQPGDTLAWYGNSGRTGQPNHVAIYTGPVKNPITVNGQVIDMTTKSVIGSKGQRTYYKIDNEGYITLYGKRVDCINALNSKNGVCLINSSDMGYSSSPYVWRLK